MSMVLARSPLEPMSMNGAVGGPNRRSARLSNDAAEENELPVKKSKRNVNGAQMTTVSTKESDGDAGVASKKKRKVYDEDDDGFSFSKSKRSKATTKAPAVRNSNAERSSPVKAQPAPPAEKTSAPAEEPAPKPAQKKVRRRLPTTPERDAAEKPVRRSKRLSIENEPSNRQASPQRASHAKSHANHQRSPSPHWAKPVTVEKRRRRGADGVEEEKVMRIQLPFADTPVIKRNKEMRKASAENAAGHRRSSSGMRGRRASSLIDEGRGNGEFGVMSYCVACASSSWEPLRAEALGLLSAALVRLQSCPGLDGTASGLSAPSPSERAGALHSIFEIDEVDEETIADETTSNAALPHSEVPTTEFFKHISAELTEPRRMRCLLGWCGTRALPPKPEAPRDSTPAANLDFQALQAARVIQEEISQDLITKGILSDWFSRDDNAPPQIPLRKKPNPRNVANAAKAEELQRELERLKKERAEWGDLIASATPAPPPAKNGTSEAEGPLSPLHPELLDSPQRAIYAQLQASTADPSSAPTDPAAIQQRLRNISKNLEFTVDQFAHGIHALSTTQETGERLADRALGDAAKVLEEREKEQRVNGKAAVDPMDALRGLARVMNAQRR